MRKSGILLPIFSLPSDYGIGTLGKSAYEFVDFLSESGQSLWQILPVSPTGYGNSPYQALSSFAGNPYFIDLDMLFEDGLLKRGEYEEVEFGTDPQRIDYGLLYKNRYRVLESAVGRFLRSPPREYLDFCNESSRLLDGYSLFASLKEINGGKAWTEWNCDFKTALQNREKYSVGIEKHRALQFLFTKQWKRLRAYANGKGIRIIGDIPIYVAYDSADVWENTDRFELDGDLRPTEVSGCPPDGFSADGQLWGNPLYAWNAMRADGFDFWCERIRYSLTLYDILRIDHFRGFEAYYAVPFGENTARNGRWRSGPGRELFDVLKSKLGDFPVIAEDLGYQTDGVKRLLAECGYPGMKVLEFAFDSREDSDHLPHNYVKNCVVYTGTHDNDTVVGWEKAAPAADVAFAREYMRCKSEDSLCDAMVNTAMASVADTVIIPMQDYLGLSSRARINTPSTMHGNWCWRAKKCAFDSALARKIHGITGLYRRL